MRFTHAILLLTLLSLFGCSKTFVLDRVEPASVRIDQDSILDASMESLIEPYRTQLNERMSEVIARNPVKLTKAQPESSLGNLLADACRKMAINYLGDGIDIGIMNYGGIRIPELPEGEISLGKVYELMPFDNMLVVIQLRGDQLQEMLDRIAAKGGWPVSGVRFVIQNGKATNVLIGDRQLDSRKEYAIAISDYLANGGDDMDLLMEAKQTGTGVFLRDAFIAYFKHLDQKDAFRSELQERISHGTE